MADASPEIERKFALDRSRRIPPLTGAPSVRAVSPARRFTQVAVYYDTPDLALLRARVTLRRRTGGTDDGWHLKTPVGKAPGGKAPGGTAAGAADTRTETAVPLSPRDELLVPGALRALVADVVGAAPLTPVAVLSTRRAVRQLKGLRGKVLAELMDDTVTAHLPGAAPHAVWRELEVELVRGTPEVLDEVAAVLLAAGIPPSASPSKAAQALGPRLEGWREPSRASSAGEVLVAALAAQVGVLQARAEGLRADAPGAVHKSRVATRRLRSLLRTFRPVLDRSVTDAVRAELAWFAGVLGQARDAEVQLASLTGQVQGLPAELVRGPVLSRIRQELGGRHAVAHAALVNVMDGRRYAALMKALARLVSEPPMTELAGQPAAPVLPGLVRRQHRRVDRLAVRAEAASGAGREELLHEVRKAAKAARYACEGLTVFGAPAARSAAAWEQVTEVLGQAQDTVVARGLLLELAQAAHQRGEETFTYGLLHGLESGRAEEASRQGRRALRAARSRALRAWTKG